MKKLLFFLVPVLLFSCTDYTDDFNTINDRLDKLEQTLPTVEEQIASIQTTIKALEDVDKALDNRVKELEDSSEATTSEIADLKDKDEAIEAKIAELKEYVNTQISSTTDWANATFATLEQYNALVSEIAEVKNALDSYKTEASTNLTNAIKSLDSSLKSWVGETLSNYYTIAEVEAKITALQTAITEGDNALQVELNKLKTQLETAKSEITAAYKKAIEEAITTNNGVINNKIASEIAAVNQRIDSDVAAINAKIAELQAQVNQNTADIAKLLARIQSVSYIPEYSDEKVHIGRLGNKSFGTMSFRISPKSAVAELVNVWETAVSCEAYYPKTRAVSLKELTVNGFDCNADNGVVTVKISGNGLSEEFFAGTQEAKIALVISDGNNQVVSDYANACGHEITDEIWYTSTDGKIVEPTRSDAFNANIVSNTYKDGMGILKFDGNLSQIYLYAFCNQETQVGAENLKTIIFPNGLAEIGEYAFANCTSLKNIVVPPSITVFKDYAFVGCVNLSRVDISDLSAWCKIQFLGYNSGFPMYNGAKLYLNGSEITNLIIPLDIEILKGGAFHGCSSIISVDIPSSITQIRAGAFNHCKNLATVYCRPIMPPSITLGTPSGKWYAFNNNARGRIIYVPRESVEAYKSAEGWSDYADYIVGYDF